MVSLRRICIVGWAVMACVSWAAPARGQLFQYTPPGGSAGPPPNPEAAIEAELEAARWSVGPIRLAPVLGLRQAGYIDDVFAGSDGSQENVSDFTATIGAGLTAYLPTGPDVYWVAEAVPEYVWWQDLEERRQAAGRYGAGVFGFFNRLDLAITAGIEETQNVASSEFPQPTVTETEHLRADVGLRLSGKVVLFATGQVQDIRDTSEEPDDPRRARFDQLDREEQSFSAGLRYQMTDRWRLGLGVRQIDLSSAASARDLSNDGTSPLLELGFQGAEVNASLELTQLELEPADGSLFTPYDEIAGQLRATLPIGWRLELDLHASSYPILSLLPDYSVFEETRYGAKLGGDFGRRLRLAIFADAGENRYDPIDAASAPERVDDLTAWGGELSFQITESLRLQVRAESVEYDSTAAGADREVTRIRTNLALSSPRLLWQ